MTSRQRANSLCVFALLLAGCAQLGVPFADTFNKQVLVAAALVTEVRTSAETVLTKRVDDVGNKLEEGQITKEVADERTVLAAKDAQNVQDQATQARAAIDIAVATFPIAPVVAEDRLAATITGLKALQTYLGGKP